MHLALPPPQASIVSNWNSGFQHVFQVLTCCSVKIWWALITNYLLSLIPEFQTYCIKLFICFSNNNNFFPIFFKLSRTILRSFLSSIQSEQITANVSPKHHNISMINVRSPSTVWKLQKYWCIIKIFTKIL
jgi:hypothetical protein